MEQETAFVPTPVARPRALAENDVTRASDASVVPVPLQRPAELDTTLTQGVPVPMPRPAEFSAIVAQAKGSVPEAANSADVRAAARDAPSARIDAKPIPKSDGKLNVVALPPSRAVARVALPQVITQGGDRPVARGRALSFVETPAIVVTTPPRPVIRTAVASRPQEALQKLEFVPARVDRSNFRTLTAAGRTQWATTYSALGAGSTLAPMRAAARLNPRAATVLASAEVVSRFGDRPYGDLGVDSFSGPAVKAFTAAEGFSTLTIDRAPE